MKRGFPGLFFALITIAFLVTSFHLVSSDSEARRRRSVVYQLRVMTFNIRHSRGQDEIHSLRRIARIIKRYRVDLVALQEVDVGTRRVGGLDQTKELARLTKMHAAFGHAIDFQGGKFGNAILSRYPFVSKANPQISGSEGAEERNVLQVKVRLPRKRMLRRYRRRYRKIRRWNAPVVSFWGTHWDYASSKVRELSANRANAWSLKTEGPLILVGDLNAEPDSSPLQILSKVWRKAGGSRIYRTIPTRSPRKQLDYILLRKDRSWRVRRVRVLQSKDARNASDHRPLLADLHLRVPMSYVRGRK